MALEDSVKTYKDPGDNIYGWLAQPTLVECSRCGQCAVHQSIGTESHSVDCYSPRRMVCPGCVLTLEWPGGTLGGEWWLNWDRTPTRDLYFDALLWIRAPFRGHEVWAFNWHHLATIENFVAAPLRQRINPATAGCYNNSFLYRLPRWLTSAKNRDEILHVIARLRGEKKTPPLNRA
jgi:hypothetical protein